MVDVANGKIDKPGRKDRLGRMESFPMLIYLRAKYFLAGDLYGEKDGIKWDNSGFNFSYVRRTIHEISGQGLYKFQRS